MISAIDPGTVDVRRLRELAGDGRLAEVAGAATAAHRAALRAAAYEIVWPLVYQRLTRPIERRRGHGRCTSAMTRLADECVDGFHDDVEAVVHDLLDNARARIVNLDAWICGRLNAATVDGNRRRRGLRGALQRPRMPNWLAAELGRDPWLSRLALHILDWVGVPGTAGADLWPLDSWTRLRAEFTGDRTADPRTVHDEVTRVLTAMSRRPAWYASYVERPLGAKQAPVAPAADALGEQRPVRAGAPGEEDDARLAGLATVAVEAIDNAVRRGENPREAVARILAEVFGSGSGSDELDRAPGQAAPVDEVVRALVADPGVLDRITDRALRIVGVD